MPEAPTDWITGRAGPVASGGTAVLRWLARTERDLPEDDGWLSAAEMETCAEMRFTKRRREFRVSRWTAKQAMAALPDCAVGPSRLEVRHHPSGAPTAWVDGRPLPVGISLSDRAGWAMCLLGLGPGDVGCDLELVEPRSAAFARDFFTAAERRFVGESDLWANLVWSAKESALKVLRTGLGRDTRTVEVTVCRAASGWSPLIMRVGPAQALTGWWVRYNDFLLTVATAVPTPPPTGIDAVPTLSLGGAVPTHGWLDAPVSPARAHEPSLAPRRR